MLNNNIPKSIQFIFKNFNLSCFQYLISIYVLLLKKQTISLDESFFYLILTLMEKETTDDEFYNSREKFQYFYFKIEKEFNDMILTLENLNFIQIKKSEENSRENLRILMTNKGNKLVSSIDSEYANELKSRIIVLKENMPYKPKLFKELKGEKNAINY